MKKISSFFAVLAIAMTAITASAETWFTTTLGAEPTSEQGTFAMPTNGTWTWSDNVGTLSTALDGSDDMTFTASVPKTLPGEVPAITTQVKFTAMDKADFDELSTDSWDGAKAGLTIVEDAGASNFYCLDNTGWVKVEGHEDTVADALATPIAVTVAFSSSDGKVHVTYTVGTDVIFSGESAASNVLKIDGVVAYRGNGGIKSLAGAWAEGEYSLTIPAKTAIMPGVTFEEPVVSYVKESKKVVIPPQVIPSGVYYPVPVGAGTITVEYKADEAGGYMGTATATIEEKDFVDGSYDLQVNEINTANVKQIVAKIGETSYALLQDAITAAVEGDEVELQIACNENITTANGNAFTLNLNALSMGGLSASGAGTITVVNGTIVGDVAATGVGFIVLGLGEEDDEPAVNVRGDLLSDNVEIWTTGSFAQEPADVQEFCVPGLFAKDIVGDYKTQVVKGVVVPANPTKGVPAIAVEPGIIPAGSEPADYLAAVNEGNGISNWVNYALGLLTTNDERPTTKPNVEAKSVDATSITLGFGAPGNPASGILVELIAKKGVGEAKVLNNNTLVLAAGQYEIDIVLVDGDGAKTVVGTKTIGVDAPTVTEAEAADAKLVTVPAYKDLTSGTALTIDSVINKANLFEGDSISIPDTSTANGYKTWTLTAEKQWSPAGAGQVEVNPGQGLWLQTANKSEGTSYFQFGEVATEIAPLALTANEWNLLSNPHGATTAFSLAVVKNPSDGDTIRIETVGATPVDYTYDSQKGGWGYLRVWTDTSKKRPVARQEWTTVESITPTGSGIWYVPVEGSEATIEW